VVFDEYPIVGCIGIIGDDSDWDGTLICIDNSSCFIEFNGSSFNAEFAPGFSWFGFDDWNIYEYLLD
jgi:hypothetical protein